MENIAHCPYCKSESLISITNNDHTNALFGFSPIDQKKVMDNSEVIPVNLKVCSQCGLVISSIADREKFGSIHQ